MYTLAAILAIDHFRTRPVSREIGLPRPNGLAIAPVLTSRRWGEVSGRRELSVTAPGGCSPPRARGAGGGGGSEVSLTEQTRLPERSCRQVSLVPRRWT